MPRSSPTWQVVRFAVFTRVATLLLQIPLNHLIPDHDPDVFAPPAGPGVSTLSRAAEWALGGLGRWDAAYFLFVAEHGYAYEQSVAFFPLFPALVRTLAFAGVGGDSVNNNNDDKTNSNDADNSNNNNNKYSNNNIRPDLRGRLLVSAAFLNVAAFTAAAVALHRLGAATLHDEALALRAALLFCATPASVFMSAAYSESLFACLLFAAALALELGRAVPGVALFALAAAARANGLASLGFPLHRAFRACAGEWRRRRSAAGALAGAARSMATAAVAAAVIAAPFVAFQLYGREIFCRSDDGSSPLPEHLLLYAKSRGYVARGSRRAGGGTPAEYCQTGWPLLYAHVQRRHWDVGFLRYYRAEQLPNFALAAPMALLAAAAVWSYARRNGRLCATLGLVQDGPERQEGEDLRCGYFRPAVFVYVAHLAVMLTFGLTCMHVQVLTRFLASSCPAVYWFAAHVTLGRHLSGATSRTDGSREEATVDDERSSSAAVLSSSSAAASCSSSASTAQPLPSSPTSTTAQPSSLPHLCAASPVTRPPVGRDPHPTEIRRRAVTGNPDSLLAANRDRPGRPSASSEPGPRPGPSPDRASWASRLGRAWLGAALGAIPQNSVTRDLARWGTLTAGARLVYGYFLSYALVGVALHCNRFPWT